MMPAGFEYPAGPIPLISPGTSDLTGDQYPVGKSGADPVLPGRTGPAVRVPDGPVMTGPMLSTMFISRASLVHMPGFPPPEGRYPVYYNG